MSVVGLKANKCRNSSAVVLAYAGWRNISAFFSTEVVATLASFSGFGDHLGEQ